MSQTTTTKMTNYRWVICMMLFFATTINYLDRQVLSLTWVDFIAPEFHWTNKHYGWITSLFSLFYAVSMLFAGRFVDKLDTKKGFLWAIGVWSVGACLHAVCGIATEWWVGVDNAAALAAISDAKTVATVINVSVTMFIFARLILAVGEAGNFPAAIKATAEYFPKKDRAYATSIFNAGATVGALAAPVTIPVIAKHFGWEMAFVIIGALGFVWMGFWVFVYKKPEEQPRVNKAELDYILQDIEADKTVLHEDVPAERIDEKKLTFGQCFQFRQTWAFAVGKFMTDGVWWFFLFWMPAYLSSVYGMPSSDPKAQLAIFVLYGITLLSIIGGWLPTYFIEKKGMNPYAGRMRAMLIFAFFPLLALLAQPLGHYSYWVPVIIIGIAGAAHQSWSANIFSTIGDMFPKSSIATITGIGGMAGGIGSLLINFGSGYLFDFARKNWTTVDGQPLLQRLPEWANEDITGEMMKELASTATVNDGIGTGYMIIFSICAVAYLIGWVIMKSLVPKYEIITVE